MKKHKIFLYPLEENGKVRVFLFQSGDIGADRNGMTFPNQGNIFTGAYYVHSSSYPEMQGGGIIAVNGEDKLKDFKITSREYTKEEFDKLKELEYAYNNR